MQSISTVGACDDSDSDLAFAQWHSGDRDGLVDGSDSVLPGVQMTNTTEHINSETCTFQSAPNVALADDLGNLSAAAQMAGAAGEIPGELPSTERIGDVDEATSGRPSSRFTHESVRILRNWMSQNVRHPFPNEAEKQWLMEETSLSRTQVLTWFANARRRNKFQKPRNASNMQSNSHERQNMSQTASQGGLQRPPTPAPIDISASPGPLQRWVESPPETEPASAAAIARAMAANSQLSSSPGSSHVATPLRSAASSLYSSDSSIYSADSQRSRLSRSSLDVFNQYRPRRRGLKHRRNDKTTTLLNTVKKFQCTFCTESFDRKYDWQRHETSIHLPLERWICAPDGPRVHNNESKEFSCVFCGTRSPSTSHIEDHNYSACSRRPLCERAFNRKDHLRQHLRLFHDADFPDSSMEGWKIPTPKIASRCGFCDLRMDDWKSRVEHLSEHFKHGKNMADWQGDWGFEPSICELVESAMPPYLIEFERNTPYPFTGGTPLVSKPHSAYELMKLELSYHMQGFFDKHDRMPGMDEMQYEACRIILSEESGAEQLVGSPSWLRDVILSNQQIVRQAKMSRIRSAADSRLFPLHVSGKKTMFEDCPFEAQLQRFAQDKLTSEPVHQITDTDLLRESVRIISHIEETSAVPSKFIYTWLVRLVHRTTACWLPRFRQRANITESTTFIHKNRDCGNKTVSNLQELESYSTNGLGVELNGDGLRHRLGINVNHDTTPWVPTQIDGDDWLSQYMGLQEPSLYSATSPTTAAQPGTASSTLASRPYTDENAFSSAVLPSTDDQVSLAHASSLVRDFSAAVVNDANYYHWFEVELRRWAMSTMSPHNPAQHIPTDQELQHYARMLAYNDDDPLSPTVADDPTWLGNWKKSLGILDN